jgi:hypothetical protein
MSSLVPPILKEQVNSSHSPATHTITLFSNNSNTILRRLKSTKAPQAHHQDMHRPAQSMRHLQDHRQIKVPKELLMPLHRDLPLHSRSNRLLAGSHLLTMTGL